jgi:hypothetical protein
MSEIIKKLLDSGNYITINKTIIKKLGLLEAVLLGDFINKYSYFSNRGMLTEDDEFFNTIENIINDTGITKNQLKQTTQTLIDYNILSVKKKGIPAKNYYKLYFNKIEKLFTSELKNSSLDKQKTNHFNKNKINKNKEELSKDNIKDESFFDSNFSPIKDELIKYFDLYKKLHPKCKKESFFKKEKIDKINKLIKYIINGFPSNNYNKIKTYIKENKIPYDPIKGFKGDIYLFKGLLYKAFLSLDINYCPSNKTNITSNFLDFLMNDFTGFSYFFTYAFDPPKLLKQDIQQKKRKDKYPEYTKQLSDILQIDVNNDIISYISCLVRKNKEIKDYSIVYDGIYYYRKEIELESNYDYWAAIQSLDGFMREYFYFLEEKLESPKFRFEYNFFKSNFSDFSIWIYKKFDGLTFFPSKETMLYKVQEYLEQKK